MSKQFLKFTEGFVWGAATSAHQTEGDNRNDWSEWEKTNKYRLAKESEHRFRGVVPSWSLIEKQALDPDNYVSGKAADHYCRFKEDVAILKALSLNAYRFSVEWSRIEPRPGEFDDQAIRHYQEAARALKGNGIEPFVTLWHRTNPLWIRDWGDWANPQTVERYLRFVKVMVAALGVWVRFWLPLSEPMWYVVCSFIAGVYPPQQKNLIKAWRTYKNFTRAFIGAAHLIHEQQSDSKVGTADAAILLQAYRNKPLNRLTCRVGNHLVNIAFIKKVLSSADFLGVQYYNRHLLDVTWHKWSPTITEKEGMPSKSDMGWEVYPEGLYLFLKMLSRYHKPLYVTENGIADARDQLRESFIKGHLQQLHKALQEGVDVRGYFYWSLLDNLEWDKGFWPQFGLVRVDRRTLERTVRPSAWIYGQIAKNNGFE